MARKKRDAAPNVQIELAATEPKQQKSRKQKRKAAAKKQTRKKAAEKKKPAAKKKAAQKKKSLQELRQQARTLGLEPGDRDREKLRKAISDKKRRDKAKKSKAGAKKQQKRKQQPRKQQARKQQTRKQQPRKQQARKQQPRKQQARKVSGTKKAQRLIKDLREMGVTGLQPSVQVNEDNFAKNTTIRKIMTEVMYFDPKSTSKEALPDDFETMAAKGRLLINELLSANGIANPLELVEEEASRQGLRDVWSRYEEDSLREAIRMAEGGAGREEISLMFAERGKSHSLKSITTRLWAASAKEPAMQTRVAAGWRPFAGRSTDGYGRARRSTRNRRYTMGRRIS